MVCFFSRVYTLGYDISPFQGFRKKNSLPDKFLLNFKKKKLVNQWLWLCIY